MRLKALSVLLILFVLDAVVAVALDSYYMIVGLDSFLNWSPKNNVWICVSSVLGWLVLLTLVVIFRGLITGAPMVMIDPIFRATVCSPLP